MEKRRYRVGLKSQFFDEAYRLRHEEGKSYGAIAKILDIQTSLVHRWLTNFAGENPKSQPKAMNKTEEEPKSIDMEELKNYPPEEQIAKLKEALQRAELKAELYDEMINVAEAKFKINIRKKAGAKQ